MAIRDFVVSYGATIICVKIFISLYPIVASKN